MAKPAGKKKPPKKEPPPTPPEEEEEGRACPSCDGDLDESGYCESCDAVFNDDGDGEAAGALERIAALEEDVAPLKKLAAFADRLIEPFTGKKPSEMSEEEEDEVVEKAGEAKGFLPMVKASLSSLFGGE